LKTSGYILKNRAWQDHPGTACHPSGKGGQTMINFKG